MAMEGWVSSVNAVVVIKDEMDRDGPAPRRLRGGDVDHRSPERALRSRLAPTPQAQALRPVTFIVSPNSPPQNEEG
jgi:hypothetical protein